ncbi:hypothetical protein GF420_02275, partial [candidate division GN15 bacterium]|nr:hypothetical protein [candidate division GN15 bacterium]
MTYPIRSVVTCALSLFIGAVLLTCSDDSSTNPETTPGGGLNVTLADTAAPAASWVELSGLSGDTTGYYGIVTSTAKAGDTGYAAVVRSDTGDYLIVPLNPADPIGGGEVQVVITDGAKAMTDPLTLTLDSLPPAPGEFDALVTSIQHAFTATLASVGLTRDSLAFQDPADVPLTYLPYLIAWSAIDKPDNPNSLRAFADGPIPYLSGDSINYDLIDRLVAMTNMRAYFDEMAGVLDTISESFKLGGVRKKSGTALRHGRDCISPPDYGITSCDQLASAMRSQNALAQAATSAQAKVENDITTGVMTIASLIPGATPIVAPIGGALWTRGMMDDGFKSMLPSEFVHTGTSFDPSITAFPEDFTENGTWSTFNLTAASNGWHLDAIALEAIMQILGAQGAGQALTEPPGEAREEIKKALEGMFIDNGTGTVIKEFVGESDIIEVCPNQWPDINCVGNDYSTLYTDNDRLYIDTIGQEYHPLELGEDRLWIETKFVFGIDNFTRTSAVIETDSIQLFLDPFQATADTSDEVDFHVRVENALDTRVEFDMIGGGSVDDNDPNATVHTPADPWDPPIRLRARSLANTGLRQGMQESDPREDEAEIRYDGAGEAF